MTAKLFDEDTQTVTGPDTLELWTYADPTTKGWKLLQEFEDADETAGKTEMVRRYGWPDVIEAGGSTPTLFEEIVTANLADVQEFAGEHTIPVIGYGIQSFGIAGNLSELCKAFPELKLDELGSDVERAWLLYKKQNGILDGAPSTIQALTVKIGDRKDLMFTSSSPSVGDAYEEGEVLQVVKDVENLPTSASTPLTSTPSEISFVECSVPTTPSSTANWFKDMSQATEMNLAGLNTSKATRTNMFSSNASLKRVVGNENFAIGNTVEEGNLPRRLENDGSDYIYEEKIKPRALLIAEDDSLRFVQSIYREPGEKHEGLTIRKCYHDLEPQDGTIPWDDERGTVKSVICEDAISPNTVSSWFCMMPSCISFDLAKLDTSKCLSFNSLFSGSSAVTSLDLSSWNTSLVSDLRQAFYECSSLKTVDLTNWDMGNVARAGDLFANCGSLETIFANNTLNRNNLDYLNNMTMFVGCTSLAGGNETEWDEQHTDKAYACLDDPGNGNPGYFTDKATYKPYKAAVLVRDTLYFSKYSEMPKAGDTILDEWGMEQEVKGVWTPLEYDSVTPDGKRAWSEFAADIYSVNFETKVSFGCMKNLFSGLSNLHAIQNETFLQSSGVTDFSGMYENTALSSIILAFDFDSATNTERMFCNNPNLRQITAPKDFPIDNITSSTDMFGNCPNLNAFGGTAYDPAVTDKTYARIDQSGSYGDPGYLTQGYF